MKSSMNRRSFLTLSAAACAGPLILTGCKSRSPQILDRALPSERVVMGAIGLGWQGPENLGRFLGRKDVQVVALCDVDQGHLKRVKATVDRTYENDDCATYNNFEDLLARTDLDAVSIALPDHWHAIPAIMAANKGLDIYGEKPISHTLVEGRAMVEAVKKNDGVWQTGSWQRSVENFHQAAQLVRNGRIGKVTHVEVGLGAGYSDYAKNRDQMAFVDPPAALDYDRWLGPAPEAPYCPARVHKNWRWNLNYGGGRIMDWVGHHLDIAHWGLGLDYDGPVMVEGAGEVKGEGVWNSHTDYDCTCTYADGLTVHISSKFPMGTKWHGDAGWLFVTRGDIKASNPEILKEKMGAQEIQLYHSRDHFGNFIDCVKNREQTSAPAEIAHRSASVGHLCMIAIETGRKIQWDPKKEKIAKDKAASKLLAPTYRAPWTLS